MTGEIVTLVTAGTPTGEDSSGEPIPGDATETAIEGCIVWRASSEEITQVGGDPVITHENISFPPGTAVSRGSQVVYRGDSLTVIGFPNLWRDPFDDEEMGVVAVAKRVE